MPPRANQQQSRPGDPATGNVGMEPVLAPEPRDDEGTSCQPARLRVSAPGGASEPALESEDGDMFLHSEEDTDY